MDIHQEYIRRHNISCPLIFRNKERSFVLCRVKPESGKRSSGSSSSNRDLWRLFEIKYAKENYKPGHYIFTWHRFTYDSHSRGSYLTEAMSEPLRVEWEQYGAEILKVVSQCAKDGVEMLSDLSLIAMAVWEIFGYSTDSSFPRLPDEIRDEYYKSLNSDTPLGERMTAQMSVVEYLAENEPSTYSRWISTQQHNDANTYALWLPEIYLGMCNPNFRESFDSMRNIA